MDVDAISAHIKGFLEKHKQTFYTISTNQSKALELAVAVGVTEHYRYKGYTVEIANPAKTPNQFVVKTGTRGYPWNFSRINLSRDGNVYEAHLNLLAQSAHDEGRYCVDVGIVKSGAVPTKRTKKSWDCAANSDLVTFAEVKKLVVYPMLLAQFLGIVHEIKPQFIGGAIPGQFLKEDHLLPALASLGHFSGNSSKIVDAYKARGIHVVIAQNFDVRLASLRGGKISSPFENESTGLDV